MEDPIKVPKNIPGSKEEIELELRKKSKKPWKKAGAQEEISSSDAESDDELPSVTYDLSHKSE